jgi:type II secretory pathway predicted ATPase ExeA
LSDDNRDFAVAVRDFCGVHAISMRHLARMCGIRGVSFSRGSVERLFRGGLPDAVVDRIRPIITASFLDLLASRGYSDDDAADELSTILQTQELLNMIANRCPLTPEAARYFGLANDPFDVDQIPGRDEVFTSPALEATLARLRDAVHYQRFVAVIGGVGTGKTLLKLRVADEIEQAGKSKLLYPEFFDMEEVTVHGIANRILAELGQRVPQSKEARVSRIREVLTQMQQEGVGVAIVLDECHRLRDKVISSLKNFWEMTNGRSSRLLGVILFGQPAFVDARLRDVRFKEIRQRVQIIEMPPMNDCTRSYIAHRLSVAGGRIDDLFDAESVDRIGVNATTPLAIGNLCNQALMAAFELDEKRVSASFEMFKKLTVGQQVLGIRRSAA